MSITTGPDGALWFAGGCIGRMTTTGLVTDVYPVAANSIITGPDGALWFTASAGAKGNPSSTEGAIGRITVPTVFRSTRRHLQGFKYFLVPTGGPSGNITVGPDGAMWFPIAGPSSIGRITTSGTMTEYRAPGPYPQTITAGPDGALWYTTFAFPTPTAPGQASVSRMTTSGAVTATYAAPFPSGAIDIVTGPDGALWFTSITGDCIPATGGCILQGYLGIVRMTTDGVFTDYPLALRAGSGPLGITTGPDGALWFTEAGLQDAIGRITTSGVITNCTSSALGGPQGITTGPDGAVWITNSRTHTIGRIDPAAFGC